jgi:hypothetical protein
VEEPSFLIRQLHHNLDQSYTSLQVKILRTIVLLYLSRRKKEAMGAVEGKEVLR